MTDHRLALNILCRIGGARLSKSRQTTTYPVHGNAEGIKKAFGIDVDSDEPDVHPRNFCSTCHKTVLRALSSKTYVRCGGGCGAPIEWLPHGQNCEKQSGCKTCDLADQSKIGGRPVKKRRTTVPPVRSTSTSTDFEDVEAPLASASSALSFLSAPDAESCSSVSLSGGQQEIPHLSPAQEPQLPLFVPAALGPHFEVEASYHPCIPIPSTESTPCNPTASSTGSCNSNIPPLPQQPKTGQDVPIANIAECAAPSYKAAKPLTPERFIVRLSPLLCKICENVADKAVQAKCGDHTFCLDCIWQWLEANDSCPVCTNKLSASQLAESPLRYCLPELVVHCDNYVDEFQGCPELMPLQDLKLHVSKCKNTGKHTILQTTPVAAVVTASPRKMEGSVCESLARHVVKTKGKTGIMEIRSRGPSEYWIKTTKARVSSDVASPRTLRRRISDSEHQQEFASGGAAGAMAQEAASLRRMSSVKRKSLLTDAGILPKTPGAGSTLALKSDLHMPWYQLRKLKGWLVEYGLHLESERKMRQQLDEQMPFNIIADNVPFSVAGAIVLRPMVTIPDVVGTVMHYLDKLDKTSQLVWHNGTIPADEVWTKVGGDHGGNSFKFSFQILNVEKPNSLRNIVPFLVFAAKDTPANLATALQPFVSEIQKLKSAQWQGKDIKVLLYGDYELQTTLYGLSGSSGVHPCLHCTISRTDMQQPDCTASTRSLETLQANYSDFVAAGAKLANAKQFRNCIRPAILPIPLEDVIVPVLHLDLGIFPWIYETMVKECQMLDVALLSSGQVLSSDSEQYTAVAAKHKLLNTKQVDLQREEERADSLRNQFEWLAVHGAGLTEQQLRAATQGIQAQTQLNEATRLTLQTEIQDLTAKLDNVKNICGPCEQSLEKVLQTNNITRQRYHGGAFIGNHVDKALEPNVIGQIVSVPVDVCNSTGREAQHSIIAEAQTLSQRYEFLLSQFAACRRRYACCRAMSVEDVQAFETDVRLFMATARREIVSRKLGRVTPKLHLLESHLSDALARFRVGIGLLAEQGGESIHHEFNNLLERHGGIVNDLERLRTTVKQHLTATIPEQVPLFPQRAKRKRGKQ